MKGNGEVSWCGVNAVQEMESAREGVAILLNDVWHSAVVAFLCVSYRTIWIKFRFSRVKVCGVVGTVPMKEMMKKGTDSGTTWTGLCIA